MTPEFWCGRRVFLTGHTGFKGSWMSLWLQHLRADVAGYALPPPTTPSLFDKAKVQEHMRSTIGDVRDLDALCAAVRASSPEIVLHFAAQPLVRSSYDAPVETYATNVLGTVHLLEAVRRVKGVRAVVNVTTDKCYENRGRTRGYREDDRLGGDDPYSNSKACSELVTSAYRASYFDGADECAAVATARAGNVIGGGDWALDRLVPDALRAFEAGLTLEVRRPNAVRPWQHVLEPLRGYLVLSEKLFTGGRAYAEAWNFGPQATDCKPVSWLVQWLAERWGGGASWRVDESAHPHEAAMLKLDASKAEARLGWQPRLSLERALKLTLEWHQSLKRGADARETTLGQIAAYQAMNRERADVQ